MSFDAQAQQGRVHFYIKHAIGSRMLFDVTGGNKRFELKEAQGGWKFIVEDVEPEIAALLEKEIWNLNLFYFVEQPGRPMQKFWYYDKDKPSVEYNNDTKRWSIQLDSRMEYNNAKV